MPLFYQHNINQDTKLGIWHIEEPESFFLEKVPLKRDVTHPFKRRQHLAGRYLLSFLFPDFPVEEIRIADTRQPFLAGDRLSFFHLALRGVCCGDRQHGTAGWGWISNWSRRRITRVAEKFLNEGEMDLFNEDYAFFLEQWGLRGRVEQEFLTLIWSAKEALFKWYGRGELDFKRHMQLTGNIRIEGM